MTFLVGWVFKCVWWVKTYVYTKIHHTANQQQSQVMTIVVTTSLDTIMSYHDNTATCPQKNSTTVMMNLTFAPNTLTENELKLPADIYEGAWKNAAVSREVNVIRTIYQKKDLAIVHCRCSLHGDLCIKLRYPFSSHEKEASKYVEMLSIPLISDETENGAAMYFPEVYAFIKVPMINGEIWGGICMKLMGQPLVDILFVDAIPKRQAENVKNLAKLSAEFWKVPLHIANSYEENEEDKKLGGVRVKRMEKRGIQTSLTVACLELLHRMHMCGWVHGDSHLGNFVLDSTTWRVYAIDMERSFSSMDAVQQMLDIQELFGHACGLIVSYTSGNHWDMDDIWGVATKLHPLLRSMSKNKCLLQDTSVLHMLPICTCFVEEDEEDKVAGCICCRSKKNVQTANFFKNHGFTHIENLFKMSLKVARAYVSAARKKTITECSHMETLLLESSCKCDLAKFISLSQEGRYLDPDTTPQNFNLDEKINFDEWLRKILYLGSFFEYWRFKRDKLINYLRLKGHSLVVSDLLTFTEKKNVALLQSI